MLVFHPPEEIHTECIEGAEVHSFNIEVASTWLTRAVGDSSSCEAFEVGGGRLVGIALRIFDEYRRPDSSSPLIIEGLTLELLGYCDREARTGSRAPRWLMRIREVLAEDCTKPFTLAELANVAGVNSGYLAMTFRRHFHCTIGEYARRQRIDWACRQLHGTDKSLAEVALSTGFFDQSHFTRVFKREMSLTPAEYRKLARSDAFPAKK